MFVAHYGNTQRGIEARKMAAIPAPTPAVSWAEMREMQARLEKAMAELETIKKVDEQKAQVAAEVEEANRALARFHGNHRLHTYANISRRICRALGVSMMEIASVRRDRHIVFARHAICYWCIRLTTTGYPAIGKKMGGRDHTTVLHGSRKYPEKRKLMGRTLRPAR